MDSGKIFGGLLTGAAMGAGIGILYAPDKGNQDPGKGLRKKRVWKTTDDLTSRYMLKRS